MLSILAESFILRFHLPPPHLNRLFLQYVAAFGGLALNLSCRVDSESSEYGSFLEEGQHSCTLTWGPRCQQPLQTEKTAITHATAREMPREQTGSSHRSPPPPRAEEEPTVVLRKHRCESGGTRGTSTSKSTINNPTMDLVLKAFSSCFQESS